MSIRVALNHRTRYDYGHPVQLGPQTIRLRPAAHCRTPILNYSLRVSPSDHFVNWHQDPSGNYVARLVFKEKVERFDVEVDLITRMTDVNPFDFFLDPSAVRIPFVYDTSLAEQLTPYFNREAPGPRFRELLASIDPTSQYTIDFLVDLNQRLSREIEYAVRMDPGVQTCEVTLEHQRGSCRDSALLLVQILRHLGMAARFTSGFLVQLKTDDPQRPERPEVPEDVSDLHAWAEVYLPGAGWIGLDPTSGMLAGEGHIPLACTPSPMSAAPITGSVEPCDLKFDFSMTVART